MFKIFFIFHQFSSKTLLIHKYSNMNVCENSKLPSSFPVVLNKIHREAGIAIESTCFFVRLTSFWSTLLMFLFKKIIF